MRDAEIVLVCNGESDPCHKNILTGANGAAEDREDTVFFLKEPVERVFPSVVKPGTCIWPPLLYAENIEIMFVTLKPLIWTPRRTQL